MNRLYRALIFDNNTGSYDKLKKLTVWRESGFEIIGRSSDMRELKEICAKRSAELIVCFNRPPLISTELVMNTIKSVSEGIVCIAAGLPNDYENMRKCFISGAVDYLIEPVGESRLKEALDRASELIDHTLVSSEYAGAMSEYLADFECADTKFYDRLQELLSQSENVTLTTEYAADWFGFNKDYFGRMFKQKMGLTFGDFYKGFRICYAVKLLASGRYKVYEVSAILGFSSVDYFTSVFKKLTGHTPSELKR